VAEDQAAENAVHIARLTDAAALNRRVRELGDSRNLLELEWKEALNFYKGNHYVYINRRAKKLDSRPVADGEKPHYRVRLVDPQIMVGSRDLIARYIKTKPVLSAVPESSDDGSEKAAKMGDAILESLWQELGMADKYQEALWWAVICGNGYWKISWDKFAGEPIEYTIGPDGKPITTPRLKDAFEEELQNAIQQGQMPPQIMQQIKKKINTGEIRIDVLSPWDVFVDPRAKTFSEAEWAICVHRLSVEEVKARYGKDLKPDAVPMAYSEVQPLGGTDEERKSLCTLYTLYCKPCPSVQEGRVATFAKSAEGGVLTDSKWDYPTKMMPLVKFPGLRMPGAIYDDSVVRQAIPLQKELNKGISQVIEHRNLTIRPQFLSPFGAIKQKLTNEPGLIINYNPMGELKPEPMQMPALQPYIFEHLRDIKAKIDAVFQVTAVQKGELPANLEAGVAIDLLQEMATDGMAPSVFMNEWALACAGEIILSMAQQYYDLARLNTIKQGELGRYFLQGNLRLRVRAETGSGLPRTKAGRHQRLDKLLAAGIISQRDYAKHYDMADMKAIQRKFEADEDQALREHEKLVRGQPINQIALQDAMRAANTPGPDGRPLNPQTGQPFQSPQEVQSFVEHAALQPNDVDNHEVHMDVHRSEMITVEFESYPPDVQSKFYEHFNAHREIFLSIPLRPDHMEPVKTSMQVRATVGPTAASKILQGSGLMVSPEDLLEEPLESVVLDNKDKANVDPNEQIQELQMKQAQNNQEMQHKEQMHAMDMQIKHEQLQHDIVKSQIDQHHQAVDSHNKIVQSEQAHQVKLKQAKEKPKHGSTPKK
jgi:hypothetical protein